jgi:hypothetical protein
MSTYLFWYSILPRKHLPVFLSTPPQAQSESSAQDSIEMFASFAEEADFGRLALPQPDTTSDAMSKNRIILFFIFRSRAAQSFK